MVTVSVMLCSDAIGSTTSILESYFESGFHVEFSFNSHSPTVHFFPPVRPLFLHYKKCNEKVHEPPISIKVLEINSKLYRARHYL
jgi:hypothetical protein